MSNTITIELCAEDRARLDRLAAALESCQPPTIHTAPVQPNPMTALPEVQQEAPEAPADEAKQEEPAPVITLDDIRAKVQKLIAPGSKKSKEAKAICTSYATRISDIPADKYTEVMERLTALEGA